MSTFTKETPSKASRSQQPAGIGSTEQGAPRLWARLGRKIALSLLRTIAGLVAILSLLPVMLLPATTSVPSILILLLALVDLGLIVVLFRYAAAPAVQLAAVGGLAATSVAAVVFSQWFAATPAINDGAGRPLPGSIAVMEKIELNSREQWITVRGKDVNKPVLLFLAGGPGGSELAWTRSYLAGLEDHFVVVNWEQPGAGKSYYATDFTDLTVARYLADAHALAEALRARFHQDKLYVLGESWGSILGIKLVQAFPDLFHAFISSGQMVNTVENDVMGYELARRAAEEQGDTRTAATIRGNGPPPYFGDGAFMKYATYLTFLNSYMAARAPGEGHGYNQLVGVFTGSEYGLLDKVNWVRGLIDGFSAVYPQLVDLDFTTQAARLQVPVYFVVGRHDVNAMASLVERYFEILEAPHKELIWFEKSGHTPLYEERNRFVEVMANQVVAQTYPQVKTDTASADVTSATDVQAFLDELLPRQLRTHQIAGAAVAVVVDGQLLAAKGYGYADLGTREPVDADRTLFRTDSTGKLFVWTAVMQLVEAGKVDLDADVNRYLDFQIPGTFAQPITLRHLLSHSAGFEDQGYLFARRSEDLVEPGLFLARDIPARIWPPGHVSGYSNYGTALAGYIVERVAGMPFEQYVEEHIFAPLSMECSTFRQPVPAALNTDLTRNYRYTGGQFREIPFQYLQVPATGEGHMSVTDMAQFMVAHLTDGDSAILRAETLQQMHSRLFAHQPQVNGFAYGFAETTTNGQRVLRHEGNNPGMSSTALFLLPEHKVGVYVAYNSNGGFGPGEELRRAFLNHFYPATAAPPTPGPLTDEQRAQISGSYRSTRMFHTTFGKIVRLLGGNFADVVVQANADGTFTTHGIGATPRQWVAVEPLVLRPADGALDAEGDLRFSTGAQGQISMLFVENNPYRAFEKVPWYETVSFHTLLAGIWLALFLLVIAAAAVTWPIRSRWPAMGFMAANPLAWRLLVAGCVAGLLFVVGLLLVTENALLYGVTPGLVAVLALPVAALLLAGASLITTAAGWSSSQWSPVTLTFYAVSLIAMAGFAWWLHYWNLLGWRI
ncbi:MAG: alpha/beta fold hydrolase [Caldilineaceae bacterium]|nr:alpha/beta fold hydrolase [Caldilineaceae bacterium]